MGRYEGNCEDRLIVTKLGLAEMYDFQWVVGGAEQM